jgi:hypothetical protein
MIATQDFLDHPFDILRRVLSFFGLEPDDTDIGQIVDGSIMQYHAKTTSKRFNVASRNSQFHYLSQKYKNELRVGLDGINDVLNRLTLPQVLFKDIQCSLGLNLLSLWK